MRKAKCRLTVPRVRYGFLRKVCVGNVVKVSLCWPRLPDFFMISVKRAAAFRKACPGKVQRLISLTGMNGFRFACFRPLSAIKMTMGGWLSSERFRQLMKLSCWVDCLKTTRDFPIVLSSHFPRLPGPLPGSSFHITACLIIWMAIMNRCSTIVRAGWKLSLTPAGIR